MHSFDERDEFWNIEKLVPKKKSSLAPFATRITTAENVIDGDEGRDNAENKINFNLHGELASAESVTYVPGRPGLIKSVTIKRSLDKYDFYGTFRKSALLYFDCKADKCDFVPFYSYMPQYSQLASAQKSYYFYWRSLAASSKFIKCDYSYLYLYVYEILNLPEKYPPESAIKLLCRLWREYRASLPRIDAYFALWIQDFCLVYNLECPIDEVREFIFDVISSSAFKEFYISNVDVTSDSDVNALIAYLSDYDWRRGKYAGGDNRKMYSEYLQEAMKRFFFHLKEDGLLLGGDTSVVTRRDAFAHSLCTHSVKCKLEIEYVPLSRDEDLRSLVTEAVRYTENKLRALFGIKSRLAIRTLDDKYKRTIDRYFDAIIAEEKRRVARENAPAYERLYDAPKEKLSFSGAENIELSSWSTTVRLVGDEAEDTIIPVVAFSAPPTESEKSEIEAPNDSGLSIEDKELLVRLLDGDADLKNDSVAERINGFFVDAIGDIILENDGKSYVIIEDYREEIAEWITK